MRLKWFVKDRWVTRAYEHMPDAIEAFWQADVERQLFSGKQLIAWGATLDERTQSTPQSRTKGRR